MKPPRRFRAYGVGMTKTGTHSLAAIFSRFRSAHEARHEAMLAAILDRASNHITAEQQASFLEERDRSLDLEMDVSQLNYFVLENLLALFADAKFILTIRDCYTWLDSLINHQLGRSASGNWQLVTRSTVRGRLPWPWTWRSTVERAGTVQSRRLSGLLEHA